MRFSNTAGIRTDNHDDWFDPVLEQDTPLYIDPYLVFEDDDPFWAGTYARVVEFFETATHLVLAAGGSRDTPAWRKAVRMLTFPEPHEFALGVALGSPRGAGTGEDFARRIAEVLELVGVSRIERLASIGGFTLFCEGIGVDRISDILANILKDRFIAYTDAVVARYGIATTLVRIKHASWNASRGRWNDATHPLLPNLATGGGVLLTPERFLKDIPRLAADGFWDWSTITEGPMLRDDLNFDLSESLTRSQKVTNARRIAHARPEVALSYIEQVDELPHTPYDIATDVRGLVNWFERGVQASTLVPVESATATPPYSENEFNDWVLGLAEDFKHVVEQTDAWKLLWNDGLTSHRPEKIAQALASVMWRTQCKNANVDLSKEVDLGRGPVDFKFSQGWTRRALLEVKLIESSHFSQGAEKQFPQYLRGEEISFGVYLVIGFADRDFETGRQRLVEATRKKLADDMKRDIRLVAVDARPKKSASKL